MTKMLIQIRIRIQTQTQNHSPYAKRASPPPSAFIPASSSLQIAGTVTTNLVGSLLCTQAALKLMTDQGYGHIFNMDGAGATGRFGCGFVCNDVYSLLLAVDVRLQHLPQRPLTARCVSELLAQSGGETMSAVSFHDTPTHSGKGALLSH